MCESNTLFYCRKAFNLRAPIFTTSVDTYFRSDSCTCLPKPYMFLNYTRNLMIAVQLTCNLLVFKCAGAF